MSDSLLSAEVRQAIRDGVVGADARSEFPLEAMRAMRVAGMFGVTPPTGSSTLRGPIAELVDTAMALGELSPSVAVIWAMHRQQVITLETFAAEPMRADVLSRLAEGGRYVASVTTEERGGGSLASSHSPLEIGSGVVRIARTAPIVTGGAHADAFLIKMSVDGSGRGGHPVFVVAFRDELDLTIGERWDMPGMRATENVSLDLHGVVPEERIIDPTAPENIGLRECFAAMAHLGWSAAWLGAARGAWRNVLRHLRAHRAEVLRSEAAAREINEIRTSLDIVSSMLVLCADEVEQRWTSPGDLGEADVQIHLNSLKVVASERCRQAVDSMIDLVGLSDGYRLGTSLGLERIARDLRAASLTYNNRRLVSSNAALAVLDPSVRLLGARRP
ncbi:acyl-CoA dehydrogenase family protein [Microbacterium sp. P04]|uniref:acyl-CoA dehydrogenase family protein n=1 Tax=Microbacterium sp. P04 TaxID=3366947 RepID=UPI003746B89F